MRRVTRHPSDSTADALYSPDPAPGRLSGRRAGFIDGVEQFDAEFFGISDTEAAELDPQQRLLLMTAWEALEDAGYPPGQLHGATAGVYVGACTRTTRSSSSTPG